MTHVVAVALVGLGVALVLVSVLGVLAFRQIWDQLHYMGPATSLGAPLIGVGLLLQAPDPHTAFKDIFTVLVLTLTGPIVTSAMARAERFRAGGPSVREPE